MGQSELLKCCTQIPCVQCKRESPCDTVSFSTRCIGCASHFTDSYNAELSQNPQVPGNIGIDKVLYTNIFSTYWEGVWVLLKGQSFFFAKLNKDLYIKLLNKVSLKFIN